MSFISPNFEVSSFIIILFYINYIKLLFMSFYSKVPVSMSCRKGSANFSLSQVTD